MDYKNIGFQKTYEIRIAGNKKNENYSFIKIEKENDIYIIKNSDSSSEHYDEIIGKVYDINDIFILKSMKNKRCFTVVKGEILYIYVPDQWIDFQDTLIIQRKEKDAYCHLKFLENKDKVYVILSLDEKKKYIYIEDRKFEVKLLKSKNAIQFVKPVRYRKLFSEEVIVVEVLKNQLKSEVIKEENLPKEDEENIYDIKDTLLERISFNNNNNLLSIWGKYNELEDYFIRDKKDKVGEIRYTHYKETAKGIRFFLKEPRIMSFDEQREVLEGLKGYNICTGGKGIYQVIGSISEVYTKELLVDVDNDLVKNLLVNKEGELSVSFTGEDAVIDRRKKAYDMLRKNQSQIDGLADILTGEYRFSPFTIKNKFNGIINGDLSLKDEQRKAVESSLNTDNIFLIQGPPGTGKTTIIKEIIRELKKKGFTNIIVTSYQNTAVDNVIDGIVENDILSYRYSNNDIEVEKKNAEQFTEKIIENMNTTLENNSFMEVKMKRSQLHGLYQYFLRFEKIIKGEFYKRVTEIKEIYYEINGYKDNSYFQLEELSKPKDENNAVEDRDIHLMIAKIEKFPKDIEQLLEESSFLLELTDIMKSFYRKTRYERLKDLIDKFNRIISVEELLSYQEDDEEQIIKKAVQLLRDFIHTAEEHEVRRDSNNDNYISSEKVKEIRKIMENILDSLDDIKDKRFDVLYNWKKELENNPHKFNEVLRKYSDVYATTCQKVGSINFSNIKKVNSYDYVIVDEAARTNPLDLFIPIVHGKSVILVGDHKQLPHIINDKIDEKLKNENIVPENEYNQYIKESLFGRLYQIIPDSRKVMLSCQYRMNRKIGDLVSMLFYNGRLKTETDIKNDTEIFTGESLVAIDVKGRECDEINKKEAEKVIELLQDFDDRGKHDIGVITFYRKQAEYIKELMKQVEFKNIALEINTVDAFQGKEHDIILLSTVRTRGLGFTVNKNRLNVALSRARKLLIFVSDIKNMSTDTIYKTIFESCYKGGNADELKLL